MRQKLSPKKAGTRDDGFQDMHDYRTEPPRFTNYPVYPLTEDSNTFVYKMYG